MEDLYAKWAEDPNSVEPSWQAFFASLSDRTDEVKRAAAQLASIVYAERARRQRQEWLARRVLTTFREHTPEG